MSNPAVLDHTYPESLIPVETWSIMDSTKLKCYKGCPRKYFYEYVLGWRHSGPNIHLDFGSAIHLIFETIYNEPDDGWRGYPSDIVTKAYGEFLAEYRKSYPLPEGDGVDLAIALEQDAKNSPKNPDGAARLIAEYATKYKDDDFEVLYTEVAGIVPIDDIHNMTFKMDLILRDEMGVRGKDFKTSGADREMYQRKFHHDTQMLCYSHALHMLFPEEEVGMCLDFLIPLKTKVTLRRRDIPITELQLLHWLAETSWWLNEVDRDFELLSNTSLDAPYMLTFRRNDQNCTQYNQLCPFFDFCSLPGFSNPLTRCAKPQPGFEVRHWDPRKLVEEAKTVVTDGRFE